MVSTPNLDIEHLQPNSGQPEVVVNTAFDDLDAKITGAVDVDIGPSNAAPLTQDEQAKGSIFYLNALCPGPSGGITVDFAPFGIGLFAVVNNTDFDAILQISGQPLATPTIGAGKVADFICDGVNVSALAAGGGNANPLALTPISAPAAPVSGFLLYVDSADGRLKAISSANNITELAQP